MKIDDRPSKICLDETRGKAYLFIDSGGAFDLVDSRVKWGIQTSSRQLNWFGGEVHWVMRDIL